MTETPNTTSIGFRRLATASVFASLFAFALTVTIIPAAINQISPLCGNSNVRIGWLSGMSMAGFFACVLLGGRYSDRRGKLPMMFAGCTLMAIGSYGLARVTTYPEALLAMFVMGAGGGFTEGISMGVVAEVFSAERRTSMMNCAQIFFAVGAVAGPLFVSWLLAQSGDWRWSLIATALFCALGAVLAFGAMRKNEEKPASDAHPGEWKTLLNDRLLIVLCIGVMLYVGAETGQGYWMARYFRNDLGAAAPLAARTVGLFWAGITVGRAITAWAAKHASDYAIVCCGLGLGLLFQLAVLASHTPPPALVAVPLLGLALGPVWPTIVSRASALHPAQTGTVLGMAVAAGGVGAAIMPPAIGLASSHVGLRLSLLSGAALLLTNFAIFLRLWLRQRGQSVKP